MTYFHMMGTILLTIIAVIIVINVIRRNMRETEQEVPDNIASDSAGMIDNRVEPSTKLIIEGFYIYTDENGTKILRDAEGQVLLDFTVYRVVFDHGNYCLVCFLPENKGIWFYYLLDQKKIFRAYSRLELKVLNNQYHIYSNTNKLGIGILDNSYTELTRTKYTSARMYDENYFLAKEYRGDVAAELLIDSNGTEILKNIQFIFSERPIDNTILVKDLQDKYFFSTFQIIQLSNCPINGSGAAGKLQEKNSKIMGQPTYSGP